MANKIRKLAEEDGYNRVDSHDAAAGWLFRNGKAFKMSIGAVKNDRGISIDLLP